jgi:hypothetical protein
MGLSFFIGLATAGFICVTTINFAFAQARPEQGETASLNNLQSQMSACLVFYQRVVTCAEGDKELAGIFNAASLILAAAARSIGKRIGMTDEAIIARWKLIDQNQLRTMKNSCVNIALLMEDYLVSCKALVDGSASVLNEFLTRDLEKERR